MMIFIAAQGNTVGSIDRVAAFCRIQHKPAQCPFTFVTITIEATMSLVSSNLAVFHILLRSHDDDITSKGSIYLQSHVQHIYLRVSCNRPQQDMNLAGIHPSLVHIQVCHLHQTTATA